MSDPTWLTAFLDVPAEHWDAGTSFWSAATGTTLSPVRGESGEFATLLPAHGDACWRVQRLGDGPAGIHLDLHAEDPAGLVRRLTGLGARVTDEHDDLTVLTSPGGLPFCVVPAGGSMRSAPVDWDGHTSLLDQVCLDATPDVLEAEVAFWGEALGSTASRSRRRPEFLNVPRPDHLPLRLLFQRLDDPTTAPVVAHPDLAATDREAEVARLVALGAQVETVEQFWTVLVAPDGRRFCVTERDPATGQLN